MKNSADSTAMRKPTRNVRGMLASGWKHLGSDQLAFARNRQRCPLGPRVVVPPRNEVISPRGKPGPQQELREIAYRHGVAAAHQNAFDSRGCMRERMNACQL